VANAFRILVADPGVRAILINIFGGILRVDSLARGIVEAAKGLSVEVPVVVRLEGTNVEEGRRILKESGLRFVVAATMEEAAREAVEAARGAG
jgi:succinyl-CoA synthetase beta subunit